MFRNMATLSQRTREAHGYDERKMALLAAREEVNIRALIAAEREAFNAHDRAGLLMGTPARAAWLAAQEAVENAEAEAVERILREGFGK